ncbi:MAG TPA: FUN14 domain-containing protein [Tepidisphaeraceae bacterium]|jgi:uncharacterized membrane protein (Fun14 family)|nr:FUN14 domain-containing protein [Tepidisphaeraceae bacterium]
MNPDLDGIVNPTFLTKTIAHLWSMHHWQRGVLAIAVLLFGAGTVGNIKNYFNPQNTPAISTATPGTTDPISPAAQPEPTALQKMSPWAAKVGGSLLGGFILGFALRTFVKITSLLLALGISVFTLLSYFHVMNVDLTSAETKYKNSIEWVDDQAYRLKDVAQSHIPSSGSGVIGAFAGFRRKRAAV